MAVIFGPMEKPKKPSPKCAPEDGWTDETSYMSRFSKRLCRSCHRGALCPRNPAYPAVSRRKEARDRYEASMRARDKCCNGCEMLDEYEVKCFDCSACGLSHALCMDCGLNGPPPCQGTAASTAEARSQG